ncbi:unnamed protein product [Brassica oleracea]
MGFSCCFRRAEDVALANHRDRDSDWGGQIGHYLELSCRIPTAVSQTPAEFRRRFAV